MIFKNITNKQAPFTLLIDQLMIFFVYYVVLHWGQVSDRGGGKRGKGGKGGGTNIRKAWCCTSANKLLAGYMQPRQCQCSEDTYIFKKCQEREYKKFWVWYIQLQHFCPSFCLGFDLLKCRFSAFTNTLVILFYTLFLYFSTDYFLMRVSVLFF